MKKLLLFVFAACAFAACIQDVEVQVTERHDAPDTITVGFEGDDTRIQLNEAQKTVWTKDDLVSVFYFSDANQKWQFQGETGDRVGNLKRVNAGEPTTKTTYNVVAYPYNEDYFLNTRTGALHTTLPATQHYLKDSYGAGDNLMVAQSEFTQFSLKSVCGWLKLQLTGDGEVVKSITFKGNNGEQVAGLIHVDTATAAATLASEMGSADDNNAGGNLIFDDTILTEVTLDCGAGVALSKKATAFYIALPPQTFEKGLTVAIEDVDGYVMKQSTNKTVSIERNTIQPMAAFEFVNPDTPSTPKPANNEIWYTATAKTEPYFDDFLTFGADVVSNVWDSETKRGVITFDGDVTMIGDDAFYNCDKFTGVTLPDSVTSIGKKAFYDCDGLIEFTIPDSVTTIGENAFYSCSELTSVTIGDGVTTIGELAFYNCKSLTSVTIGNSVTTIGTDAFNRCSSLTSVTIPDSVTTIGYGAFYGCNSLTEFNCKFAQDNGRILVVDGTLIAFAPAGLMEYTIPNSVTTIGENAFQGCSSLTSVTIPDSVTTIEDYAFYSCSKLTSVTIPDSVTTIGEDAFNYCENLTSVTIPDSVTTIGNSAFHYCKSLTSVTIGDSVTTIGESAFSYCENLKKVYCNATMPPSIGSGVFYSSASVRRIYVYDECVDLYKSAWSSYAGSIYTNGQNCPNTTIIEYTTSDGNTITSSKLPIISNTYENGVGKLIVSGNLCKIPTWAFSGCTSLTSVTIPDSVTTIGYQAFYGCSSLTSVTIPDSVTTIGEMTFYHCNSLSSVTIPDSVTTIEHSVFSGCTSLTSVTIPDSVTTIGENAFQDCDSLTSVTIPDSVTTIGRQAFSGCSSLTSVTIPDSVTEIENYTFYNCTSLTSVTIGDSVTTIGENAFRDCDSLTSVTIPDSVTTIESYAFYRCDSLTEFNGKFAEDNGRILVVDGTLVAFAPAGLTEYSIPDSVTTIGENAFDSCSKITSVIIGDSVTAIGKSAFWGCGSLTSVTIGDSVTTIGEKAFYYCSSLKKVYCNATTPPSIGGSYVFYDNGSGRKIYVPTESVEAYKIAKYWSDYASAIVGYDF